MSEAETWELDVVAALDRRIATSGARPDFLDVVTRAHAIDPQLVTADALAEADALVEADAPAEDEVPAEAEAELDGWLSDVRAAVDRRARARREQPLPSLPATGSRRAVWWIAGVALAAAIVLVVGVGQAVRLVADSSETPEQALHLSGGGGAVGTVETVEPRAPARLEAPGAEAPAAEVPEVEVPAAEVSEVEVPAAEVPAAAALEASPSETSSKPRGAARGDRWKALAEQAQAHWRAGRRDQAQRLFVTIVTEAGRSRAAELAYADLFTLASQAGDASAQRRWWKDYLRRFPRGRFADDARAGLCRGAAAGERAACWETYLEDFPKGSFRGEAQAAQGRGAR